MIIEKKVQNIDDKPILIKKKNVPQSINKSLPLLFNTSLFIGGKGTGKSYKLVELLKNYEQSKIKDNDNIEYEMRTIIIAPTINSGANEVYKILKIIKQRIINKYDTELIVKYLLLAFLSGSLFPPRRSLDFALLKIKNYDEDVDNYYKKGVCYFNNYKTKNVYGKQTMVVPKELDDVIKKFNKINPTDFMLFSTNGQPLTSSQITRILNDIFNMNVSTSMLRHIFLSDKYANVEEQMKQDAIAMSHSSLTQNQYIVKY